MVSSVLAQAILNQQVPDIVGSFQRGQETGRANAIRTLAGQAASGDEDAFAELTRLDPETALQLGAHLQASNAKDLENTLRDARIGYSLLDGGNVPGFINFMDNRMAGMGPRNKNDSLRIREMALQNPQAAKEELGQFISALDQGGGAQKPTASQQEWAQFRDMQSKVDALPDGPEKLASQRTVDMFALGTGFASRGDTVEDVKSKAIARASGDAYKAAIKVGQESFQKLPVISSSLSNIDRAIGALDAGANTGVVSEFFPSIKAASVRLGQIKNELGLDVVGSATFGALSESELKLALDTALPTKLSPPELRQWLLDKKEAMRKLRDGYETTALKLSRGDSTLSDLVEEIRAERVEAEARPAATETGFSSWEIFREGQVMPIFEVQDPETGMIIEISGDTTPTEADLEAIFSQSRLSAVKEKGLTQTVTEGFLSATEPTVAGLLGAVAEPVSGIIGGLQALNPLAEEGAGARAVEGVKSSLSLEPSTDVAKETMQRLGAGMAPVAKVFSGAESFLGDSAMDLTGSPAIASLATALPTAALEALGGIGAIKSTMKGKSAIKSPKMMAVKEADINKAMLESAPDITTLMDTSRAIYKEIDGLGVNVKPEVYNSMIKTVRRRALAEGADPVLTPKSARTIELLSAELSKKGLRSVSDLETARKKARIAASSLDPADASIGAKMIDEIDSFMDNLPPQAFKGADAKKAAQVGTRYKVARNLWGRARRAELIQEAMDKAGRAASGFENGIRTNLRAILNNKKRSRFFTKEELAAMNDVVKRTNEQNMLKLVGRLGFSEGQATNILGGLAAFHTGGSLLAMIGQGGKKLSQRATKNQAALSDAIVKAGPNGKKITEAYLRLTPAKQRSALELSDLFLDSSADIDGMILSSSKLARDAAEIAKGRKAFGAGAIMAGSSKPEDEQL